MSQHHDEPLNDDLGDDLDAANGQPPEENGKHKYAGLVSWVASGALHATAVMLAGTIFFLTADEPQEIPPIRTVSIPPPPDKPIEKKKIELLETKVVLEIEKIADTPSPITALTVPDETSQSEDQTDSVVPKGREEAVANSEMGGSGAFMMIGVGGPPSGIFGSRSGGGRTRALKGGGGTRGSETAVNSSLNWFKRHQSPNGMWDHERYFQNCTDLAKCEPGRTSHDSAEDLNACMTGYALLCFLGAGHDHMTPNVYRTVVKKGLDYLLSVQKPDGLLAARNYAHPVAAMALAEAYAMTCDPALRKPAQAAIDMIVRRQNQDPKGVSGYAGLGWNYISPDQRNDASVTGWNIMALKSAHAAGLNIGNAMDGAKNWLEQSWKANNDGKGGRPDWQKLDPYKDESRFSYVWTTGASEFADGFGHQNMAPVGLVCSVFLGRRAGDPMLETLANFVMNKQTPKAYPTNTYYMYYNTLGIFQLGGERWKVWNSVVRDMLVGAQRKEEGCVNGSWNWEGTQFTGNEIGRVLSTAYNTLCLEVYYRYAQVQGAKLH